MKIKPCIVCKADFEVEQGNKRTCSPECSKAHHVRYMKNWQRFRYSKRRRAATPFTVVELNRSRLIDRAVRALFAP